VALLRRAWRPRTRWRGCIAADPGRDSRQIHLMDRAGGPRGHTGKSCVDWCGHLARQGITVAGNMLAARR
jgi:uncharacterized Ntn-hydrolase superfamily protein